MSKVFGKSNAGTRPDEQTGLFEQATKIIVQTGIPGFDENLGQGLPSGNLYLVSGTLGSKATLLAQQILYNILITKGKVTYYTVENPSTDIISDMQLFGMNIQQYVDDGSWIFARPLPQNMKKIFDLLPEVPMEQKIEIGDSLSNLMNHFHDSVKDGRSTAIHLPQLIRNFSLDEIQNLLFFMTGVVRKYGGVHFLLLTEGAHDENIVITIKDAVDSVFDITTQTRGNTIEIIVTIQKIRNMLPKVSVIRLALNENGMATETIRRVQ